MADEDRREALERIGVDRRHVTPDDAPGQVSEQRVREHAHAVEIDQDCRVTEERQPIGHAASRSAR
jgi:hypothetical protein